MKACNARAQSPRRHHRPPRIARRMRSPRKAYKSEVSALQRWKPTRHTRRWWYHILSELFWGSAWNSGRRVNHWRTQLMSSLFSSLIHIIKKEAWKPQDRSLLARDEHTRNEIAWFSWSKNPTCQPDGGILSQQLMHHDSAFTVTNVMHLQSPRKWKSSHLSLPVSSPFLSSIWRKGREKSWRILLGKSRSKVKVLGELKKIKRMKMISFSQICPNL